MLDRDDTVLKTYIFKNAWPMTVGGIAMNTEEPSDIGKFDWVIREKQPGQVGMRRN